MSAPTPRDLRLPFVLLAACAPRGAALLAVTAALVVPALAPAQTVLQFAELPRQELPPNDGSTSAVVLGDVDGDGDLDMVCGNQRTGRGNVQNRLYLNDGTGTFAVATTSRFPIDGDYTNAVALGDVDGDGDLDLVIGSSMSTGSSGQNRLYLNDGAGTFADATASHMPVDTDATSAVALGDVDGDGDLDLVIGNRGNSAHPSQNRLYLNDGRGGFSDATATQLPVDDDACVSVALGDMDNDGDLDLVFGNAADNSFPFASQHRIYVNDGLGTFTDATAGRLPLNTTGSATVALGDVDRDGDLDVVIGNFVPPTSGCGNCWVGWQNRLYLNDGAGAFSDATTARMPVDRDVTLSVALGDVDGDGDLDLVFGNGHGPGARNRLYLNDGSGAFSDATAQRMFADGDTTTSIALGDVDGDGDLDLAIGNSNFMIGHQNRVLVNLQRQLHAPADLQIGQTYTLEAYLRHVQPSPITFALPYVSFAPASIPIPPYGTLGIDPSQAIPLPAIVIPQPAGVGSVDIPVPNNPGLVGTQTYSQSLLVPYPNPPRLSNVVTDVVQ